MATVQSVVTASLRRMVQEGPLGQESTDAAAARLLGIVNLSTGRLQIDVASDRLVLADKVAIEKLLLTDLQDAVQQGDLEVRDWLINFRRAAPQAQTSLPADGRPVPAGPVRGAFGIVPDKRAIPGVTRIIAVGSGKGGVGKSTVSVSLAVALAASGARVGLLDADIYGPSAPTMLGLRGPLQVSAERKLVPARGHGIAAVSVGFLAASDEPAIWRGPMVAKAFRQLCYDVDWGELDWLVIDLPPGTGDVQLTMIENVPIHGAVVVTTPQEVALIDALKAVVMFQKLDVPVIGLIENMAAMACPCCGHLLPVFGQGGGEELARKRQVPFLGRLPLDPALREAMDRGLPAGLPGEAGSASGQMFGVLAAGIKGYFSSR